MLRAVWVWRWHCSGGVGVVGLGLRGGGAEAGSMVLRPWCCFGGRGHGIRSLSRYRVALELLGWAR
eukprot:6769861-Alexandrium_andersonii.AAC.1